VDQIHKFYLFNENFNHKIIEITFFTCKKLSLLIFIMYLIVYYRPDTCIPLLSDLLFLFPLSFRPLLEEFRSPPFYYPPFPQVYCIDVSHVAKMNLTVLFKNWKNIVITPLCLLLSPQYASSSSLITVLLLSNLLFHSSPFSLQGSWLKNTPKRETRFDTVLLWLQSSDWRSKTHTASPSLIVITTTPFHRHKLPPSCFVSPLHSLDLTIINRSLLRCRRHFPLFNYTIKWNQRWFGYALEGDEQNLRLSLEIQYFFY
jgi:hypothetical protein